MQNVAQSFYAWYRRTLRSPKYRWLLVAGTLLYLISPIDIAPDFIPIVGWIDDAALATLLVSEVSQLFLEFLKNRKVNSQPQAVKSPHVDVASVEVD